MNGLINGPRAIKNVLPFAILDDVIPSRFVMAYDDNLDICFVGLDAGRIGETANDGTFTDLGDNETRYKVDCTRIDYSDDDSVADDDDVNEHDDNDDDVNDMDLVVWRDNAMLSAGMQRFLQL